MAGNNVRKRLREETTCSLCLDFFTDPVIMECGHNFCQTCILTVWNKSNTFTASCPQCRKTVSQKTSRPNRQLGNLVDLVKELNDEAEGGLCESHQEPLKFFCKDDEAPICVVCERSKGHREHWVVPVDEATEEYKDKIRTCLEKSKEELLACKEDIKKQSQDLLNMVERERQKTVAALKVLRQYLEKNEKYLLDQMKEADTEIVKKRDEEMARLSEELSSLENIMLEMEDKCEKSPHEFLKDIKSKLQRCKQKEKFKNPVAFPLPLKWRIWDFGDFGPILEGVTKNLKDTLKSSFQQHKETVILEPQTAHPQLLISEDGKCLTLGDKEQSLYDDNDNNNDDDDEQSLSLGDKEQSLDDDDDDDDNDDNDDEQSLPDSADRFVHHWCVLGSKCYRSGIHWWEVEVGKEEGWAVGVCIGTSCDIDKPLGPEAGVWAIGKWDGQYRALIPPLYPSLPLSEEPKTIQVSLNHMGRQVAFFDADTAVLLYSFPIHDNYFNFFFPFFWLWKKSCLRLDQ